MENKTSAKWQWPATLKGTATYFRALNVFSHHVSLSSTSRLQDGFGPPRLQLLRSALACLRLTTFSFLSLSLSSLSSRKATEA